MQVKTENYSAQIDRIIDGLSRLRRFDGTPAEFWPRYIEGCARLVEGKTGMLLVRENNESWKNLVVWPSGGLGSLAGTKVGSVIEDVAEASTEKGYAWQHVKSGVKQKDEEVVLGVRLNFDEENRTGVAIFLIGGSIGPDVEELTARLKLVADIPAVYQMGRISQQAQSDVVKFADALDLMVLLNAEKKYMAAAMTFCNELASRFRCTRVSLGWLKGGYVRVQAISHMEKFEKKMEAVQSLEAAMEEALDQDEELLWPKNEESTSVIRDHEVYAREIGAGYIISLPIRIDDEVEGVVTCERMEEPFSEIEVSGLRLLCDQAARRLADLRRIDRWFGARFLTYTKESFSKLLGVEHTLGKLIGLVVFIALAVLLFGRLTYRVEAPFILKTDDLVYLPAPFDGYIDKVPGQVGDLVKKGDTLLSFDIRELLLEESTAIANKSRYTREAEKARAQNALADMKIAQAMKEQAQAQLDLVRYHIDHAELKAPFAGIVVEGDLKELLGAPVHKGDVLFKIARIEKMYAELEVSEKDIHEISIGLSGEIAFVSRPELKFPIKVERIDPVAVTKEKGNVFIVRGVFTDRISQWWRPGMSGISKINVGKRNIFWIITHRTVDFLRIFLWW